MAVCVKMIAPTGVKVYDRVDKTTAKFLVEKGDWSYCTKSEWIRAGGTPEKRRTNHMHCHPEDTQCE